MKIIFIKLENYFLRRKLDRLFVKNPYFLEEAFRYAYEHGIEKAGYKKDAIPGWKHEKFLFFRGHIYNIFKD